MDAYLIKPIEEARYLFPSVAITLPDYKIYTSKLLYQSVCEVATTG